MIILIMMRVCVHSLREMRNACKILVRKPENIGLLRTLMLKYEDNIKMDFVAVIYVVVWVYTRFISYRTKTSGEIFCCGNEHSGSEISCVAERLSAY